MIGPLGRLGAAATLGQHCPQMTQRRCTIFQKQSPFLDDMNNLIHLAQQMGLLEMGYQKYQPNATKCQTIQDVYKSHAENNEKVRVKLSDVYGILSLLGLGFGLAVITVIAETSLPVRTIK